MEIVRGKYAGQTGRVHQFANHWLMVDLDDDRQGVMIRPDYVKLSAAERDEVVSAVGVGTFWQEWKLNEDGTFSSLRPRRPRRKS